jgi:hypothetical protein
VLDVLQSLDLAALERVNTQNMAYNNNNNNIIIIIIIIIKSVMNVFLHKTHSVAF